jgi:LytS/YehU family sensor histidine kinase
MPVIRDVITNGVILLFFFINYDYFIPHLYFTRKYMAYGACILFCLLCICVIPVLLTGDIRPGGNRPPPEMRFQEPVSPGLADQGGGPMDQGPAERGAMGRGGVTWGNSVLLQMNHSIYLYIAVILFSILLRVRDRLYLLQKEKINAELSSLKSQINPHFLFNTLNSIYALAVKGDEKTADAVINLAGLMRYMIKEAHGDRISLQKELDYLTNYVELQKSRLRETAAVSLSIKGQAGALEIAPLILITFVENAFKYGINPDMESRISIDIDIHDGILDLSVFNTKVVISSLDLSTGIGLDNTRSRLEKLYYKKHRLEITDEKDYYTIFLSIHLI